MRAEIKVSGIVQGVGFRPFIYRIAIKNRLVGYVRNRGDAVVEIVVEGKKNNFRQFLKDLKDEKPPLARIYDLTTNYSRDKGNFKKFIIVKSSEKVELSGCYSPRRFGLQRMFKRTYRSKKPTLRLFFHHVHKLRS